MSKLKYVLFTLGFVAVALVIPLVLLLLFVSSENISIYVLVFGIIFFASIGFIMALIISVKKDLLATIEELKVQNAAIAYRLSKVSKEEVEAMKQVDIPEVQQPSAVGKDSQKVNLNPETPLEPVKKTTPVKAENFDDFQ